MHLELAGWAELCEANFRHKALLVQAELARNSGHDDEARDSYTAAAASAAAAGYVQHEALAHELHFEALRDSGAAGWHEALALSRSAYERWGALAKVADLDGLVS